MTASDRIARETRAMTASVVCFLVGAALGTVLLWGAARPLAGDGAVTLPAAGVAGAVTAAAFGISTVRHHRGETSPMPPWQAVVSAVSAVALTIAFGAVVALGVLLGGEVLGVGLQGLELSPTAGGLLTGAASAAGGWIAFGAGIRLRTADLASLLFVFLVIGTLFAMLTANDPRWWERNFSQLGVGVGSWAFNGTLLVAGLLVATVGAYIGRDLHRLRGDAALPRIAWVVVLFAAAGILLATVGLLPVQEALVPHMVAAFGALAAFTAAAVVATIVMVPPPVLLSTSIVIAASLALAVLLWRPFAVYSAAGLEVIVVGLGFVWVTTFVRTLAALAPRRPLASARRSLLRAESSGSTSIEGNQR